MTPAYDKARSIALMLLGGEVATEVEVARAVDSALVAVAHMAGDEPIDRDGLLREVESNVRVWVGISGVLDDPRGPAFIVRTRRGKPNQ